MLQAIGVSVDHPNPVLGPGNAVGFCQTWTVYAKLEYL